MRAVLGKRVLMVGACGVMERGSFLMGVAALGLGSVPPAWALSLEVRPRRA